MHKLVLIKSLTQNTPNPDNLTTLLQRRALTQSDINIAGPLRYHMTYMPEAGFDPSKQREDCYHSTTLPPSHHGWIIDYKCLVQ